MNPHDVAGLCRQAAEKIESLKEELREAREDTERLDYLLRFLYFDDIGDEECVVGVLVRYEPLKESLIVDPHDVTGSMMDGWKGDLRAVIDKAIEREYQKLRSGL